jgi:hypothetical protein
VGQRDPVTLVVGAGDYMIREGRGADADALPPDTLMQPTSIAEAYWMLHRQPRDAWTSELDPRPFREKW